MRQLTRLLIFCLLITSLSSCSGWRLRGSGTDYFVIPKTFVDVDSSRGKGLAVYREIHSILARQKALESRAEAEIQLVLGEQNFDKRTISVNNSARTAEFQLTLKVPYKILNQQGTVLYNNIALLTRSYRFDEQDIVGKHKEEDLLKKEMTRDIAHQIFRQLSVFQD